MGMKSRRKGKSGEREARDLLNKLLGVSWRRSQQVKGTQDSADIETVDVDTALWAEIKRTESTVSKALYAALSQAEEESGPNIPFVLSRRNREKWVFCIDEDNIDDFCSEWVRLKNLSDG